MRDEVHTLGAFVHGCLTAFHGLGIVYNLRRRNWWDVLAHTAGVLYDLHATRHHYLQARRQA